MIVHYSIAAELARQRQEQMARGVKSYQSPGLSRRRRWAPDFLARRSSTRATQSAVVATA
jgi:hypothetical protein